MSLTPAHFDLAKAEAMLAGSQPKDLLEALHVIDRLKEAHLAVLRNQAWMDGRRADGVAQIPGLTDRLTELVRRFAACTVVRHADFEDLHRAKSQLCKELKKIAPSVEIETIIGEGYEVVAGFDELYRLLRPRAHTRAKGFTKRQTEILHILATRGSIHTEWGKAVQRHMSNIRAILKKQGLDKRIVIATHGGEGLYTVSKGRELLAQLAAGEILNVEPKPKKKAKGKSAPRTPRAKPQPPTLSLVVAA